MSALPYFNPRITFQPAVDDVPPACRDAVQKFIDASDARDDALQILGEANAGLARVPGLDREAAAKALAAGKDVPDTVRPVHEESVRKAEAVVQHYTTEATSAAVELVDCLTAHRDDLAVIHADRIAKAHADMTAAIKAAEAASHTLAEAAGWLIPLAMLDDRSYPVRFQHQPIETPALDRRTRVIAEAGENLRVPLEGGHRLILRTDGTLQQAQHAYELLVNHLHARFADFRLASPADVARAREDERQQRAAVEGTYADSWAQ